MKRSAGILCPIFSLPSPYGIGTLGKKAYEFIDFLKASKQTYWQILPIGVTGFGDSPYQTFSVYAGNPYFIDLDLLKDEGLLTQDDIDTNITTKDLGPIDYATLYKERFKVLKIAADNYLDSGAYGFKEYSEKEDWLDDHALFMALKDHLGGGSFIDWPKEYRLKDEEAIKMIRPKLEKEMTYYMVYQYFFYTQYMALKDYANKNGIKIIGDIPIYCALDSVDVWSDPNEFQLDEDLRPIEVAGCPPDGFAADGQLWGNPLFDWDYMKEDDYRFWIKRIRYQLRFVDVLRIDHFRGFESYYAIPAQDEDARNGRWRKGPGIAFFNKLKEEIPDAQLIAEDLGFLTDEVIQMVKDSGYPGMKVIEFAFDSRDTGSGYLPHTYDHNCVAYTGTHDNDTIEGWYKTCFIDDRKFADAYIDIDHTKPINWQMIRVVISSVADIAIIPIGDYLGLGHKARINTPSTIGHNWTWRLDRDLIDDKDLIAKIKNMTCLYGRD